MENILFYLIAYLVGGIPFGLILAKQFAGVDIKNAGSGNIGATNVLRVVKESDPKLAKKLGAITLFLDAIKGAVVIGVAYFMNLEPATLWAIGVLAVIGHCYSPFLKFEGGKGVATGMGVLLVLIPLPTLIGVGVWAIGAKLLKISSMSSLAGLIAVVASANFLPCSNITAIGSLIPLYLIAFIIFYKHIPNIARFIKGEEKKIV